MKTFIILCLSFIVYTSPTVTGVALDLKSGQLVNTGSNVKFKITATVSGNDANANNDVTKIKTITGVEFLKSDDSSKKSAVTCTISEETSVIRETPKDFECTETSLTTAGNYKLTKINDSYVVKDNAGTTVTSPSVTGTVTMEVKAQNTPNSGSGKFLCVSSLFLLLLFL